MIHDVAQRRHRRLEAVDPNRPSRRSDPAERGRRLNERLRAEFLAGAEAEWRNRTGRPMTAEELKRVLRRFPGDV
jgi:hypothetical protein